MPATARAIIIDEPDFTAAVASCFRANGKEAAHVKYAKACIQAAEESLAGFKGASIVGSICESMMKPDGSVAWASLPTVKIVMHRQRDGWAMFDCKKAMASSRSLKKSTAKIECGPYRLMGMHIDATQAIERFGSFVEQGLFPIDAPLIGAYADYFHPQQANALGMACLRGSLAWIQTLISMGADPNGASAYGKRPLHFCAQNASMPGMELAVQALAIAGADFRAKNAAGKIPSASIPSHMADSAAAALLRSRAKTQLEAARIATALEIAAASRAECLKEPAAARRRNAL